MRAVTAQHSFASQHVVPAASNGNAGLLALALSSSGPINKSRRSFFFLFFLVALTCQRTSTLFYVVNCALRLCTSSCLSHRFVLSSQIQGRRVFRSEHCKSRIDIVSVDFLFGSRRLGARRSPVRILGVLFCRCVRESHRPLLLCAVPQRLLSSSHSLT